MSSPKVSLIAIAYNIENYIQRCIESLIQQTLPEIEIIIVNDGSTDDTLNKIQQIAETDNRITILSQSNQGPNAAREAGFKVATGEYIQFVDGDDWLDLKACEQLYQHAKKHTADIVLYHYQLVGDREKQCKGYSNPNNDPIKEVLLWNIFASICIKFIKRDFLIEKQIEFIKKFRYSEDLLMGFNLLIENPKLGFVDQTYYYYYKRADSATSKPTEKLLDIYSVMEKIKDTLKERGLYEKFHKEYEYCLFRNNFYGFTVLATKHSFSLGKKLHRLYSKQKIDIKKNQYIMDLLENRLVRIFYEIFIRSYLSGVVIIKLFYVPLIFVYLRFINKNG